MLALGPVDPDMDEAEHVAHADGPRRDARPKHGLYGLRPQHYDRHDDARVEGFQAIFACCILHYLDKAQSSGAR